MERASKIPAPYTSHSSQDLTSATPGGGILRLLWLIRVLWMLRGAGMHSINREARINHNHPSPVSDKRDESAPVRQVLHPQYGAWGTPTPIDGVCGPQAPFRRRIWRPFFRRVRIFRGIPGLANHKRPLPPAGVPILPTALYF